MNTTNKIFFTLITVGFATFFLLIFFVKLERKIHKDVFQQAINLECNEVVANFEDGTTQTVSSCRKEQDIRDTNNFMVPVMDIKFKRGAFVMGI